MNTLFSHLSPDKILADEGFIVGEQKKVPTIHVDILCLRNQVHKK